MDSQKESQITLIVCHKNGKDVPGDFRKVSWNLKLALRKRPMVTRVQGCLKFMTVAIARCHSTTVNSIVLFKSTCLFFFLHEETYFKRKLYYI